MSLFKAENYLAFRTPERYRFNVVGYRTYPNQERLGYADDARIRYRRLLFALKSQDPFAIELFASLLCLVYDDVIDGPDAITCVPPSTKSPATRSDAMALMARKATEMNFGVIDGSSWLRRKQDVPKAHQDGSMRQFNKQHETIECVTGALPREPKRIVVIDDICTSGTTMQACVSRLRTRFPLAQVSGFAFGYTGFVKDWPGGPDCPQQRRQQALSDVSKTVNGWRDEAWPLAIDAVQSPFFAHHGEVHGFARYCVRPETGSEPVWSKAEADAKKLTPCLYCRPFKAKPHFEMNFYTKKIHHVDCHTGPSGYGHKPLWSLRQGIRLGGIPCKNCMSKWPMAKTLYYERLRKGAA
jgi:predicted amidophosphoribosyltransferase